MGCGRAGSHSLLAAGGRLAAERSDPRRAPQRAAPFRPKRLLPLAAGAPVSCLRVTVSPPPCPAPSLPSLAQLGSPAAAPATCAGGASRRLQRRSPPRTAVSDQEESAGGGTAVPRSSLRREEPGRMSPFSPAGKHGAAPRAPTFPWGVGVPVSGCGRLIAAACQLAALCGVIALGTPSSRQLASRRKIKVVCQQM